MGNRSKPSLTIRRLNENRRSSLSMEISVIKSKNLALAKELSESKQKYSELFKEIVTMRSKLFELETVNTKLVEVIRRIDSYGRSSLTKLVGLSDDVTQILQETARFTCVQEFHQVEEVSLQGNKDNGRTRAVKPMISGHTIIRPTITLQRVPAEQLVQLRNVPVSGDINGDESNSHENGQADSLTIERTSPFSDEHVNDGNEEVNNNSINEQSGSISPNLNRLSTLQEENINNITQINNSRTANDSSNSLHSARFQEARVNLSPLSLSVTPTTGWNYSLFQLNSARNPIVKLQPLPTQQDTNLTPTERNTNLTPTERNTNLTRTASSSSINSTKEICNLQVNLRQLPSEVLQNFPALNKENVNGNSFTKPPARFFLVPPHKEDFKHSTTNGELSCHDLINNTSIFNDITTKNSLTKFRENEMDDAMEESLNVSTLVNVSLETSRLSDRHYGDTNSYDPLEGPSTLLDTFEEQCTLLNGLGLAAIKNTSTPYTPTKVTIRRKRVNPFYSPSTPYLLEPTMLKKSVTQENSSPVSSLKVSRIGKNALNNLPGVSSKNIKSEESSLGHYNNCSVNITRLPNSVLTQNLEKIPAEIKVEGELTGKTSLKRKTTLSRKTSPFKNSPRKRRPRLYTPGALKEPSLNKKLRRFK